LSTVVKTVDLGRKKLLIHKCDICGYEAAPHAMVAHLRFRHKFSKTDAKKSVFNGGVGSKC